MQIISHRNFALVAHDDSEGETRVANYNKPVHTVHRSQFPQHVPDEYAADPHLEMMRNDGHVFTFEPATPQLAPEQISETIATAIEQTDFSEGEPTQDAQPKNQWVGKRRK